MSKIMDWILDLEPLELMHLCKSVSETHEENRNTECRDYVMAKIRVSTLIKGTENGNGEDSAEYGAQDG
jgi:hypothetical protein